VAPIRPLDTLTPTTMSTRTVEALQRSCAKCHGLDGLGRGSEAFPKLAGQRPEYLERSLHAYAQGSRPSGIMESVAVGLDDDTIRELAAYYTRLDPAVASTSAAADAAMLARGRAIAHEGLPARRVPACVECHEPDGRQARAAYPRLAGQPADYLVGQLELFKAGHRGGGEFAHLMDEVAPRLEADEMRAVARYFASLGGKAP
jgi:cytochrome c553